MNPLKYLDTLETIQLDKLQLDEKETYTKEEVINLIKGVGLGYRKAIFNGEYIMTIEDINKCSISVKDTEMSIQKLLTHDDKYLVFVQVTDDTKEFTLSDMEIMAQQIGEAVKKSENISGVLMLPTGIEVSLITAKLETLPYADVLELSEEDYAYLNAPLKEFHESIDEYKTDKKYYGPFKRIQNTLPIHDYYNSTINYK